ncbi:MAG TPA: hypothetical protein VNO34_09660, partial [Actinomycetota bacterium]|nr:hypothetical protein [Actinomycetota bacterium]
LAFVLEGGRVWVTTSRRSVKARAWRQAPEVAGMVQSGGRALAFRGRVRLYDPLDPGSWLDAALEGPRVVRAAVRYALRNAPFVFGYAVDARRLPLAWSPPARVLAGIDLEAGRLLRVEDGAVLAGWGTWPEGAAYRRSFAPGGAGRPVDLRAPASVRSALGPEGPGVLAVVGRGGPVILPAVWRRGRDLHEVALPRAAYELTGGEAALPAGLAMGAHSPWRATGMRGILLQGRAEAYALGPTARGVRGLRASLDRLCRLAEATFGRRPDPEDLALLVLRAERVVWWEGWGGGAVGRPGRSRRRR